MPNKSCFPRRLALAAAVALVSAACGSAADPRPTPPQGGVDPEPKPWVLAWSDEFEGAAGSAVDATKWVYDVGGEGWGNQEREYYTSGNENAALDGSGQLVITAREEPSGTTRHCWYGVC